MHIDWSLTIAVITAIAAMVQAHHANKAAEAANKAAKDANALAKQELEAVQKRQPRLHFAISAKQDEEGKVAGYRLIVINYGDAPAVLSRVKTRDEELGEHPIYGQEWPPQNENLTGRQFFGEYVDALCNSIVVMPSERAVLFNGEKQLRAKVGKPDYVYFFPIFDAFAQTKYHLSLVADEKENVTVKQTVV